MANAIEERKCKAKQQVKRTEETEEFLVRDVSAVLLGLSASVGTVHPTPECYWFCAHGSHAKLYFYNNCNFISDP